MNRATCLFFSAAVAALVSGCGSTYSWRSSVPENMRTVCVPTFRNESDLNELGAISTRQVLREFQREGTFAIRGTDEAALEVQGIVKSVSIGGTAYSRRTYGRQYAGVMTATIEVSIIDKRAGSVLIEARNYTAKASAMWGSDMTTAERDASGRLADDLARQIVDDVLRLKW